MKILDVFARVNRLPLLLTGDKGLFDQYCSEGIRATSAVLLDTTPKLDFVSVESTGFYYGGIDFSRYGQQKAELLISGINPYVLKEGSVICKVSRIEYDKMYGKPDISGE